MSVGMTCAVTCAKTWTNSWWLFHWFIQRWCRHRITTVSSMSSRRDPHVNPQVMQTDISEVSYIRHLTLDWCQTNCRRSNDDIFFSAAVFWWHVSRRGTTYFCVVKPAYIRAAATAEHGAQILFGQLHQRSALPHYHCGNTIQHADTRRTHQKKPSWAFANITWHHFRSAR